MNNKSKLRFSVIIPVFNSKRFLRKCLNSVVNQSFRNYEIILIDDGSTDTSGAICDGYAKKHDNITVIHKDNQGQIAARTDGVKKAIGEYIVFVDSDDTIEPNALEVINSKIEQYHPDGVIYESSRISAHGIIKIHSGADFKEHLLTDKAALYREILSDSSHCAVWKKAFRKTMFTTSGFEHLYGLRIGEDFYQTMDLIANASSVLFIPDDLYNYRNNPDSILHKELKASRYKIDFTSALFVVDLMKREPFFSNEDIKEHSIGNVSEIAGKLEEISNLKANYERKVEIFEQIKKEPYFKEYILKLGTTGLVGRKKKMYELFLDSKYKKLIIKEQFSHFPSRIKGLISVIL